ncbi:CBO0543 family protein [Bacillus sp. USDA818B3_A]|uniref:CBO0543 family protein n=1 Tax=Bacillus sp. USDA818B3_A TaxID=2698834 RepID=UPI00136B5D8D|nr:CBO0543 family protein [Bacillus sp. USDA818B3_A]
MTDQQNKRFNDILSEQDHVVNRWVEYWKDYSTWETWQFWAILIMLVLPLIVLYFTIDRRNAFKIGFYGFNIHVWFNYSDSIAMRTAHVSYPYQVIPLLPVNFALDASLVPVSFMLLYQWCLKHDKNVYLYGILLSAFFSFILKPILVSINIMKLNHGMSYFNLFLNYILILFIANVITKVFEHLKMQTVNK